MLKRIINVLLLSAVLTVGLTATVALAAPGIEGCSGHHETVGDVPIEEGGVPIEECQTGPPDDDTAPAEGFGAVTSQRASEFHDIGEHSSNPTTFGEDPDALPQDVDRDTPRKGVGNVARTDSDLVGLIDLLNGSEPAPEDIGTSPGAHSCLIGVLDDAIGQDDPNDPVTSCTNDPGLPGHPGGQPE